MSAYASGAYTIAGGKLLVMLQPVGVHDRVVTSATFEETSSTTQAMIAKGQELPTPGA